MTYQITYWSTMANGEGRTVHQPIEAANDDVAMILYRDFCRHFPSLRRLGDRAPILERIERLGIAQPVMPDESVP